MPDVPTLSRWCVRVALAYLVGGMGMGSWMLILEADRGFGPGHPWTSLHAHILLIGFLLMLVIGVAFWMFPRIHGQRPGREIGWLAFALINAGLLLRVPAQPLADDGTVVWRVLLGVAAVLPALGAVAFMVAIWPRVQAAMSPDDARRLRASRGVPPRDV